MGGLQHENRYTNSYEFWDVAKTEMTAFPSNHKNVTIDSNGWVHYQAPYVHRHYHPDVPVGSYNYHAGSHASGIINHVRYHPATRTLDLNTIHPRKEDMVTRPEDKKTFFSWDLDDDWIWDEDYIIWVTMRDPEDPDGPGIPAFQHLYSSVWPIFYWDREGADRAASFHYNSMRMTQEDNGLMAILWMDAGKANHWFDYENNQGDIQPYPEYEEYSTQPEIFIVISKDKGISWSEPFAFRATDPEFSGLLANSTNTPSFMYLADKVIRLDEDTVRLYIMYNDNPSWGSYTQGDGEQEGATIRYAALDFDISEIVNDSDTTLPQRPKTQMLAQNYPNPFNPSTTINFDIPRNADVKLSVYNIKGQLVKHLLDENMVAGNHSVVWNGKDANDRDVASGVYFYRIQANGNTEARRMILMK